MTPETESTVAQLRQTISAMADAVVWQDWGRVRHLADDVKLLADHCLLNSYADAVREEEG